MRRINVTICVRLLMVMLFVTTLSNFTMPSISFAQTNPTKLKAVFMFKFGSYITWPQKKVNDIVLCTYDRNPFGDLLEKIAEIQNSDIQINHMKNSNAVRSCDLTYFSDSNLLSGAVNKAMLTVSDDRGFAKRGGMIEMQKKSDRIKLIINLPELERAGLKASSRLLEIAEVIR